MSPIGTRLRKVVTARLQRHLSRVSKDFFNRTGRYRRVCVAVATYLAASCTASPPAPLTLDCYTFGLSPVADPDGRFETTGFSVLPPRGLEWCVAAIRPGEIVFVRHALMGKLLQVRPTAEDAAHTFVAHAGLAEPEKPTPFETTSALQAFVRQWQARALGTRYEASKVIVLNSPAPNATHIQSDVVPELSLGANCVRYNAVFEERNNPQLPRAVLVLMDEGVVCRHPASPTLLLFSVFSERYVQGQPRDVDLVRTLRQEVEPFLRSITPTSVE